MDSSKITSCGFKNFQNIWLPTYWNWWNRWEAWANRRRTCHDSTGKLHRKPGKPSSWRLCLGLVTSFSNYKITENGRRYVASENWSVIETKIEITLGFVGGHKRRDAAKRRADVDVRDSTDWRERETGGRNADAMRVPLAPGARACVRERVWRNKQDKNKEANDTKIPIAWKTSTLWRHRSRWQRRTCEKFVSSCDTHVAANWNTR